MKNDEYNKVNEFTMDKWHSLYELLEEKEVRPNIGIVEFE